MKVKEDFVGRVFGKLTVLSFCGGKSNGKMRYVWACKCECGGFNEVLTGHLRSGAIKDCGCHKRSRKGYTSHPLWGVWANMIGRCTDPNNKAYGNYGGRGILVSDDWMEPEAFVRDMGPRPLGFTLERRDNSGPYSAENCIWADRLTQASNRRNVPLVQYSGKSLSVAQWSRVCGVHPETIRSRIKAGWDLTRALSPTQK